VVKQFPEVGKTSEYVEACPLLTWGWWC